MWQVSIMTDDTRTHCTNRSLIPNRCPTVVSVVWVRTGWSPFSATFIAGVYSSSLYKFKDALKRNTRSLYTDKVLYRNSIFVNLTLITLISSLIEEKIKVKVQPIGFRAPQV